MYVFFSGAMMMDETLQNGQQKTGNLSHSPSTFRLVSYTYFFSFFGRKEQLFFLVLPSRREALFSVFVTDFSFREWTAPGELLGLVGLSSILQQANG
jgi:hypothetical protein